MRSLVSSFSRLSLALILGRESAGNLLPPSLLFGEKERHGEWRQSFYGGLLQLMSGWDLEEETSDLKKEFNRSISGRQHFVVVGFLALWNFIYGLRGRTQFRKHEALICWGKQVAAGKRKTIFFPLKVFHILLCTRTLGRYLGIL